LTGFSGTETKLKNIKYAEGQIDKLYNETSNDDSFRTWINSELSDNIIPNQKIENKNNLIDSNLVKVNDVTLLLPSKVLHHPNKVLFNSQPFELEVFTDFLKDELESVSLFYKIDKKPQFIEIPFDLALSRYVYRYDPKVKPAEKITYFFTIILKNGAIHAVPTTQTGELKPITQNLVDPVEYYEQRAAYKK
jgi:hypothetical protein